jgi:hypothetical protein
MSIQVKGTATQREYNRQLEQVYLDKLFDSVTVGKEFQSSYKMMAELTEVPSNIVSNVMKLMSQKGVLKRRYVWRGGGNGETGGRTAYWTIITSKEHAKQLLDEYQANLTQKRRPTTNAISPEIARKWVDDNSDIAQARAWVDKTRTYMKGVDLIQQNLAALKDAGIKVDEEAYLKSINVVQDERLSCIALVMPYINHLEKRRSK